MSALARFAAIFLAAVLPLSLLSHGARCADDTGADARYVLDYPAATQFCVPLRSYAEDVTETLIETDRLLTQHMPNGGYGLPVVAKVQGKNLLHLGADVGWYRAGAPVFAMTDGVVRILQGPEPAKKPAKQAAKPPAHGATEWGNLVVIEHRQADGSFITSIYGHLANKRLVKTGEIVRAGQPIGTIGRAGVENGGYKPHLHFGIREGRGFEEGDILLTIQVADASVPIRISKLGETEIEIDADQALPARVHIGQQAFDITSRDGKRYLPATMLHKIHNPRFPIVGYGLTTKGWRDPTEFLREKNAGQPPAP